MSHIHRMKSIKGPSNANHAWTTTRDRQRPRYYRGYFYIQRTVTTMNSMPLYIIVYLKRTDIGNGNDESNWKKNNKKMSFFFVPCEYGNYSVRTRVEKQARLQISISIQLETKNNNDKHLGSIFNLNEWKKKKETRSKRKKNLIIAEPLTLLWVQRIDCHF